MQTQETSTVTHISKPESHRTIARFFKKNSLGLFIGSSFLALPTLLVLAATKQTAGFAVFVDLGAYQLVLTALWVLVIIAGISGGIYIVQARTALARILGLALLAAVVSSFVYLNLPQSTSL